MKFLYLLGSAMLDHRGEQMTEPNKDGTAINLTLGLVLERACVFGGEANATPAEKFRQFKLAQRIAHGTSPLVGPTEFSVEELAVLKALCAQVYSPIAYGAVIAALELPHPDTSAMEQAIKGITLRSERAAEDNIAPRVSSQADVDALMGLSPQAIAASVDRCAD